MNVFKFGLKYWKRNIPLALLFQVLSLTAIVADLMLPLLSGMFINFVIMDKTPEDNFFFGFLLNGDFGEIHTMELCINLGIIFMILLLIRITLVYIKNVGNQRLGLRLETDLRQVTFKKLMELDSETISEFNTGELLTTINSDTIMFKEMFCRIVPVFIDCVFALILSVYMLSTLNISLLIIPVILTPFLVVAVLKFKKIAKKNYREIRGCNSEMNLTVQENIEAVRLVRSFTNEEVEKKKFDTSNEKLKSSYIQQIKLSSKFEVVFSSIKQFAYVGTIAVSAVLIINGYMLVGYLATCSSYVLKIMDYITQINNIIFQMQQQLVSGNKMLNYMATESKIPDTGKIVEQTEVPNIKVNNATLVLNDRTILKNIDIDIPYGKKLGIVGGTGCGKSMLLESLVRIHDMTAGDIEINGKNVRDYSLENLRNYFSYVFQDVFLFSNTIDSNISYSEPYVDRNAVVKAAKHAQAHGFIKELPEQYETIVGERGLGISGGQKQRVSIARALLKDADVLILDDSTSALDVNTEKKLLKDIKEFYPEKTIIISAHRLSSVVDCDEILYMQDGMIIERGTFDELMALNGHFAKVYNVQETQRQSVVDFDALAAQE